VFKVKRDAPMGIGKIGIIANSDKENAVEYSSQLKDWLEERGIGVFLDEEIASKLGKGLWSISLI
jgi:NAD kinase